MNSFGNVFKRISSLFVRRQLVGKDSTGNCYYKKVETDFNGTSFERRLMVPGNKCACSSQHAESCLLQSLITEDGSCGMKFKCLRLAGETTLPMIPSLSHRNGGSG